MTEFRQEVKNYLRDWSKNYTVEFRGAARGVVKSSNFRTFPPIFSDFRPRCGDFVNYKQFAAYVQKRLDKPRPSGYNGAGRPLKSNRYFTTGAGLMCLAFALCFWRTTYEKFAPLLQKRLDKPRSSAQILMRYTIG